MGRRGPPQEGRSVSVSMARIASRGRGGPWDFWRAPASVNRFPTDVVCKGESGRHAARTLENGGQTMYGEESIFIVAFGTALLLLFGILVWSLAAVARTRRRAREAGYSGIHEFMMAVPRNEQEKREAVNMAFRGLALCLVGIVLTPLLLLGVPPLYYGGRKVALSLMGTDLLADDEPA